MSRAVATKVATNVGHWPLWSQRKPVIAAVLVVEVFAMGIAIAFSDRVPIQRHDWVIFGILAGGSILHLQAIRGGMALTRMNNLGNAPGVDLKSVWSFAGLLLLPPSLAVALVVVTALSLRVRGSRTRMFRWVYTTAAVTLATEAAMAVLYAGLPPGSYPDLPSSARGVGVIILAAAVRWFVNFALVVAVILLSAPKTPAQDALGNFSSNLVELAALSLGAVTALVVTYDPWYLALLLPLLLVLHRTLLLRQYEVAARTDTKTGLSNTAHWSHLARTELARAERDKTEVGVLMLDLDHFKKINDNYGHLTGDAVLKAVADALRKQCREYDVVGRFGGEEFMVLVPGVDAAELMTIAERFRQCVGTLIVTSPDTHGPVTVTVSVGAVVYPHSGHDLDELLLAADAALYQAKEGGRNRACLAPQLPDAVPLARQPEDHS
ncbi:MAG TPA: GGDEF domain-containing protein [Pseudonocardiaceae bacterium]|nr:GGDEF domain-containing protein [Pseudonocardiaceae bacterium]